MHSLTDFSGFSRRKMLERSAVGFGSLALASLLGETASGDEHDPLAAQLPMLPARAKRIIFLFMKGGPSHLDTFDPKPALVKYAGQQPTGELYKKSKGAGFMPSP